MEYVLEKYLEYCKARRLPHAPWYGGIIEKIMRDAVPSRKDEIVRMLQLRAEMYMERGEGLAAWRASAAKRVCEKYL